MIRYRDEPKDVRSGMTQAMVKEIFSYDPIEGVLRWRKKVSKKVIVGQPAGTMFRSYSTGKPSSLRTQVYGKAFEVHRLIWLYMTGEWPKYLIDHKDQNGINNKWENLREADRSQNARNSAVRKDNQMGMRGIIRVKDGFRVEIMHRLKSYRLGVYTTEAEARAARRAAVIVLFGEFGVE
jgi:HNH endonuclease